MKKVVLLTALVLVLTPLLAAQDKGKASEMSGTVCDQKCVKPDAGKSACDLSCTETSGDAVFIDDQGNAWKVANPAVCKGKMGKKVKVRGKKMDDEGKMWIEGIWG